MTNPSASNIDALAFMGDASDTRFLDQNARRDHDSAGTAAQGISYPVPDLTPRKSALMAECRTGHGNRNPWPVLSCRCSLFQALREVAQGAGGAGEADAGNDSKLGVITQQQLTDRAKGKSPNSLHVSVDNFMNAPQYEEVVEMVKSQKEEEA